MRQARQQDWAIADAYITDEVDRRVPKKAAFLQEKLALQDLAGKCLTARRGKKSASVSFTLTPEDERSQRQERC
jgi:hypothetical protein